MTEREEALRDLDKSSAQLRMEPARKNEQFSLIAKMAAVSKTAGKPGAPAVQVAPVPTALPSFLTGGGSSSGSGSGSGSVSAAAKKWGGGDKPTT